MRVSTRCGRATGNNFGEPESPRAIGSFRSLLRRLVHCLWVGLKGAAVSTNPGVDESDVLVRTPEIFDFWGRCSTGASGTSEERNEPQAVRDQRSLGVCERAEDPQATVEMAGLSGCSQSNSNLSRHVYFLSQDCLEQTLLASVFEKTRRRQGSNSPRRSASPCSAAATRLLDPCREATTAATVGTRSQASRVGVAAE